MALVNYKYNKCIQINYSNVVFFCFTLYLGVFLSSEADLCTTEPLG